MVEKVPRLVPYFGMRHYLPALATLLGGRELPGKGRFK
jgi:hypothetical protein